MNRIASACLCFLVAVAVSAPAVADRDNKGHRDYKEHGDYKGHRGYRERPYDKHRLYDRYEHRGRNYSYQGHWRSWDEWDGYYRGNPRLREHGDYYREDGHLMFRFCDPDTGGCFFFSIGL